METNLPLVDKDVIASNLSKVRQGIDTPIYVHFTTWVKRDHFVKEMLTHFSKQTVRPTKIICWLSKREYHHTIPATLQECLTAKLMDEVRWVSGNTYGHKRWEAIKYYSDCYNIMIDDDLYYPEDYIEKLIAYSLSYPGCAVCYYSRENNYEDGVDTPLPFDGGPTFRTTFLGGMTCIAPHLYPKEALRHRLKRRLYCEKCDDSWNKAWSLRYRIPIVGCYPWIDGCLDCIPDTQEVGIYETTNHKKYKGIYRDYYTFVNALICAKATDIAEQIWPKININKYKASFIRMLIIAVSNKETRKNIKRFYRSLFKKSSS